MLALPLSDGFFYVFMSLFTQTVSVSGNATAAKGMGSQPIFHCRCTVSIRDLLSWVNFINATTNVSEGSMGIDSDSHFLFPVQSYVHGACLVFLDALGAGMVHSYSTTIY